MLAPHIKKKVDKLWDRFWAAGLTNPLVAVEQITYLIFLKRLEDIDRKRGETASKQGKPYLSVYEPRTSDNTAGIKPALCRWSYIRQQNTDIKNLIDNVFPWLRGIESRLSQTHGDDELSSLNNRMADAYFQLDPNKGQVLADAVDLIDQLFARAGDGSAAQDIMGDTFEYLLDEVATAGKNGQFRTPRHLIRFMVELLDPEPGQRVIDPAAGTGGFLFSVQQYLMRKFSTPENLVLEWDGTPHRLDGAKATPKEYAAIHNGANFVGLDNDRTMARIGWMNLILHDVADPHLLQGDSLSKREGKSFARHLQPESYDFVLANPPFTGTVDSNDLEKNSLLFPHAADKGKKKDEVLTNKSELLFLWLMLDLLDIGGACAVIIPEGVLFGNTDAHVRLRRELLTEHVVEAVISLPGGLFQPYTGVKTSVLVFRKETRRDAKQKFTGQTPQTDYVWFYEVEEDGFSRDAKRSPRPGQRNDLWDALVNFKAWQAQGREGVQRLEKTYFQPSFHAERWRQALLRDAADQLTPAGVAFAHQGDTGMWDGQVWGIHELFPELPVNPKEAEAQIKAQASDRLHRLVNSVFYQTTFKFWESLLPDLIDINGEDYPDLADKNVSSTYYDDWRKQIKPAETEFNRIARDVHKFFEKEDSSALPIWKELVKDAMAKAQEPGYILGLWRFNTAPEVLSPPKNLAEDLASIAREVAKLDGFDVVLRSPATDQQTPLDSAKHWVVPVREWLRNDDWQSADGSLQGSHDANGLVRPQYIEAMLAQGLYAEEKGQWTLQDGLLDPDCIEARDWNLSAGQYKPFDFTQLKSDKSVAELIGELKATEQQIISGLDKLLAMVEGRE